ncbi:type I restriction enzyme M protein [Flavobacterium caeni]|uniref:site-specific DNA-methyltransferase (adenine-specific) n=2 Tax=Flavobacterium caeni TaxID=490189 RepID=A0A1G5JHN2_9FLAO|nr:type I restriction enzyme M protein [Flavobacterium caeni]
MFKNAHVLVCKNYIRIRVHTNCINLYQIDSRHPLTVIFCASFLLFYLVWLHLVHYYNTMFEQTFKNIDDILYKDAGADSELDYIEQTSWILFLRYLDELEKDKHDKAELQGKTYSFILDEPYRWPNWAMPKGQDGKLDQNKAKTGQDLVKFVDQELFPYLAEFKQKTENPKTIEYKIGEIFSELNNKIKSGYNLREVIEKADELLFRSSTEKHELSHLYEAKIKNMGNAGRNGGQYYTPRPLIRAMIEVIDPKIGEKIYDGACGSCGFLCEAFDYLYERMDKSTSSLRILQEETLYGKEKKNLAYIIGTMNMILHGIEAPNIIHTNTLSEDIRQIQEKDRYHVILANPPFGGKERPEVQHNFDIRTGETASLFLQHFIKSLKTGGRAAIVIKNTFLSNADNASVALRKHLLETCDLHTVLDMPGGTFLGAGVKTVVLFFTKGEPTQKTWFYQLDPGRSMGKTNPLNDNDMREFVALQKTQPETEKSWNVSIADVQTHNYDLSVKNPNKPQEAALRSPMEILEEMQALDKETKVLLNQVKELVG